MPTRRGNSHVNNEVAIVPTKDKAIKNKKPLQITITGQTDKPRITGVVTSGKKKKPK